MVSRKDVRALTKGEKTKRNIFKTALRLFREKGYDNVSVDEIVSCAGIAKGTFYIYFPSKTDLAALVFEEFDDVYNKMEDTMAACQTSTERVYAIVEKSLMMTEFDIGFDLTRIGYQAQFEGRTKAIDTNRPLYTKLTQSIALGQASGEFNSLESADYYAGLIVRNIRGTICEWCMTRKSFDIVKDGGDYMKHIIKLLY